MWKKHNENPGNRNVPDCTVRAISKAMDQSWMRTYWGLCLQGAMIFNMPSADETWWLYLKKHGWQRRFLSRDCPVCYTVNDFCQEYPYGVYVLGLDGHVLTVVDGEFLDTWDSGERNPIYYWTKEE